MSLDVASKDEVKECESDMSLIQKMKDKKRSREDDDLEDDHPPKKVGIISLHYYINFCSDLIFMGI